MTAKPRAWAWALALVLVVAWPFLRTPTARFGDDDLEYAIPFSHFVLGELGHGRWPHWNPATDGGLPTLAQQPWMGPIYPGFALFALLPDGWALNAGYALHATLYAVGIGLLSRRLGASSASAWVVGAAMGLASDVAVTWNRGYLHHLVAVSWIAWPIAAFECARRGRSPTRATALGALALGLGFLGGHPVSALQSALAFALWSCAAIVVSALRSSSGRSPVAGPSVPVLRSLVVTISIALGALAVSVVQLVPLEEMARQGTLAAERQWKPWDLEMAAPWRKIGYVLPAWEAGHKGRDFVGVTTLLLAVAGLATLLFQSRPAHDGDDGSRGSSPTLGDVAPACLLAAIFLLLSLGPHTRFFAWACRVAPPLGRVSYPYFFAPGIHVALATLAAIGLDGLRSRRSARIGLAAMVLAGMGSLAAVCSLRGVIAADPLDHHGVASSVIPAVMPLIAVVGVAVLAATGRLARSRAVATVALVLLAELASYRVRARVVKPRYDTPAYFHVDDPLVRKLSASGSAGRIWHVERGRPVDEWLLRRNGGLVIGYEEIARSARIGFAEYRDFVAPLGAEVEWENALAASGRAEPAERVALDLDEGRMAVLDGLSVDRIVTDVPLSGVGASQFRSDLTDSSGRVTLWSRVAPGLVSADGAAGTTVGAVVASVSQAPGRIFLNVHAEQGVRVLVRQNPLPAWRATLDPGTPRAAELRLSATRSGVPGLALDVPAGSHQVALRYVPGAWPAWVSALAGLTLVAVAGGGSWRTRRTW